jgi:hypothetical protein
MSADPRADGAAMDRCTHIAGAEGSSRTLQMTTQSGHVGASGRGADHHQVASGLEHTCCTCGAGRHAQLPAKAVSDDGSAHFT